ncbi:IS66 family insertion sequence element accessory protein TnpB [Candidatus Pacearchaeota archaeon]|nr:IS66 family insertion sequence element accessory protein TnpB [Candidatus Pacearchaeota archaeon]
MFMQTSGLRVFLAPGVTDMRKSINGLSIAVDDFDLDPFSGHLFAFCNRRRNMIKIIYWDRNGFCLWHKRLEKDRFRWPDTIAEVKEIESCSLNWLLAGLDLDQPLAHGSLTYSLIA